MVRIVLVMYICGKFAPAHTCFVAIIVYSYVLYTM